MFSDVFQDVPLISFHPAFTAKGQTPPRKASACNRGDCGKRTNEYAVNKSEYSIVNASEIRERQQKWEAIPKRNG